MLLMPEKLMKNNGVETCKDLIPLIVVVRYLVALCHVQMLYVPHGCNRFHTVKIE